MMLLEGEVENDSQGYDETFKMMPITKECPYIEAVYIPEKSILFVMNKEKKFNLVESGKEKGKLVEKHYEYVLKTYNEIKNFVNNFASNAEEFDYLRYMN